MHSCVGRIFNESLDTSKKFGRLNYDLKFCNKDHCVSNNDPYIGKIQQNQLNLIHLYHIMLERIREK